MSIREALDTIDAVAVEQGWRRMAPRWEIGLNQVLKVRLKPGGLVFTLEESRFPRKAAARREVRDVAARRYLTAPRLEMFLLHLQQKLAEVWEKGGGGDASV